MSYEDSHVCISIREEDHERLKDLRPYDSVSFADLVSDLIDGYESGC